MTNFNTLNNLIETAQQRLRWNLFFRTCGIKYQSCIIKSTGNYSPTWFLPEINGGMFFDIKLQYSGEENHGLDFVYQSLCDVTGRQLASMQDVVPCGGFFKNADMVKRIDDAFLFLYTFCPANEQYLARSGNFFLQCDNCNSIRFDSFGNYFSGKGYCNCTENESGNRLMATEKALKNLTLPYDQVVLLYKDKGEANR